MRRQQREVVRLPGNAGGSLATGNHEKMPVGYGFRASSARDAEGREDMARCEDADPVIERLGNGHVLLCVADGLGGYPQGFDGKRGGRIASETAAKAATEFFKLPDAAHAGDPEALTNYIHRRLRELAERNLAPSQIRGSMGRHKLATTLAAAVITEAAGGPGTALRIFWIGDSRVYFFSGEGLHQLTRDDTVTEADPYSAAFQAPPMSQFLAATMEREWRIHRKDVHIGRPGVLMLCTDGCTSDWETPWQFELALQKTLDSSVTWDDWVMNFKALLDPIRSDDAAFIAYPLNLGDLGRFKALRAEKKGVNAAERAVQAQRAKRLTSEEIWRRVYQPSYETTAFDGSQEREPSPSADTRTRAQQERPRTSRFPVSKTGLATAWLMGVLSGVPMGVALSPHAERILQLIRSLWRSLWPFM